MLPSLLRSLEVRKDQMKPGKLLGGALFVIGLIGPVLFYASAASFPTYQAFPVCPLCPHVEVPFGHPLLWLQIGLSLGLFQGSVFAVLGFAAGYLVPAISQT
jgi:hypothetical protein